jgi:hypothetical protein
LLTFDNCNNNSPNAFNSIEALKRILDTTMENIETIISKKKKEIL